MSLFHTHDLPVHIYYIEQTRPKKPSGITSSKAVAKEEAVPGQTSSSSPAAEADTMSTFTPPKEQEDLEAEGGLSKGYGLAPGTTNTYAIPGMDEMSAEGTYVTNSNHHMLLLLNVNMCGICF